MKATTDFADRLAALESTATGLRAKLAIVTEGERWLLQRDLEATETRIQQLKQRRPLGAKRPRQPGRGGTGSPGRDADTSQDKRRRHA